MSNDDILAKQVEYYRLRASEYDITAYGDLAESAERIDRGDLAESAERIDRIVADLAPSGSILELACGTGMWTRALAAYSKDVTALDASAESIAIARARCPDHAHFDIADIFRWRPVRFYDVVFFAFWLSHVPSAQLDGFLVTAIDPVAPNGRLLFVDEHADPRHEEWTDNPEIAIREMTDGSRHEIVKVFVEPEQLAARLDRLGWLVDFDVDHAWLIGSARRR